MIKEMPKALLDLFILTGDDDRETSVRAQQQFAKAITTPLRQGILVGDISTSIFEAMVWPDGKPVEFPLDLLSPGEEDEHVAYTMPFQGRIPERHVEGTYVTVPSYQIANAIDWNLKYAREANYLVAQYVWTFSKPVSYKKQMTTDGTHYLALVLTEVS